MVPQVRFESRLLKCTLFGQIVLSFAGCSVLDLSLSSHPDADQAAHLAPAYRRIIATQIEKVVGPPGQAGVMQISGIRRVQSLTGPAWLVCLKINAYAQPRYYAVFIEEERIKDSHMAVAIDQCEQQAYDPYDWLAETPRTDAPATESPRTRR